MTEWLAENSQMVSEFDAIPTIIGVLFLVLPALLGRLCSRFGISEVVGFVFAGVILGPIQGV